MMSVSVGRSTMAVNTSIDLWRERLTFAGFVADMLVRICVVKWNWYVEEHRGLGGNTISRLDNGVFAGLIQSWLVLTD